MRSLPFDKLFPMLAASLSTAELAKLREWIAGIAHPGECIALIEQAARGRPRRTDAFARTPASRTRP